MHLTLIRDSVTYILSLLAQKTIKLYNKNRIAVYNNVFISCTKYAISSVAHVNYSHAVL